MLPDEAGHDDTPALDLKITIRRALALLTPRQQAVLVLRFLEDLPRNGGRAPARLQRRHGAQHDPPLARLRELAPELDELRPIEEVLQ